jgi:hypothetical protein
MSDREGEMKTPEQIAEFARNQARTDIHPLTCGNDSRHRVLVLKEDGTLACPDCDYVQAWNPWNPPSTASKFA